MSAGSDHRLRALHAAVVAAPDDDAPRQVYGDWLLSQADPRGELIAVQLELAAVQHASERELLVERERALRRELAPLSWAFRIELERGFVRKLQAHADRLCARLDDSIEWTCLRELEVWRGQVEREDVLEFITARLDRMALVELRLRGLKWGAASLERLLSSVHLRGLERLELRGCSLDRAQLAVVAQRLAAERLRGLSLARNTLGRGAFAPFATAESLGGLERLDLLLTGIGADDVDAIFGAGLPLSRLELSGNELGPAVARRIAESPQSAWLTHLGLAETGIGEEGIAALISSPYLTRSLELTLDGHSLGLTVHIWDDWDGTMCGEEWAGKVRKDLAARFRVSAAGAPYVPEHCRRISDYWEWERQQGRSFTEFRD